MLLDGKGNKANDFMSHVCHEKHILESYPKNQNLILST